MKKYTVWFGIERDRQGNKINSVNIRIGAIKSYLSRHLQGYTWIDTTGYWEGVSEKSVKLEILGGLPIIEAAKFIKKALDQETVIITTENVDMEII